MTPMTPEQADLARKLHALLERGMTYVSAGAQFQLSKSQVVHLVRRGRREGVIDGRVRRRALEPELVARLAEIVDATGRTIEDVAAEHGLKSATLRYALWRWRRGVYKVQVSQSGTPSRKAA